MTLIVLMIVGFLLLFWPTFRCAVSHPFALVYYGVRDLLLYFKQHRYNDCHTGELVAYTGLFGRGKTLSVVHAVTSRYRRYNDVKVWCPRRLKMVTQRVKVISNVELSIPYERFESLLQVVDASRLNQEHDDLNDTLTCTLVLGDEFSVQLNSRKFKENIDPLFLNSLLTCRHYRLSIYYTSQRFGHVDALLRQVTSAVIECNKLWRFQRLSYYDAWDMENATSASVLRPYRRSCWFVRDADYAAYDTYATVDNLKKRVLEGDMLTEEEILSLQRNTVDGGMDAVGRPSRSWFKQRKKGR